MKWQTHLIEVCLWRGLIIPLFRQLHFVLLEVHILYIASQAHNDLCRYFQCFQQTKLMSYTSQKSYAHHWLPFWLKHTEMLLTAQDVCLAARWYTRLWPLVVLPPCCLQRRCLTWHGQVLCRSSTLKVLPGGFQGSFPNDPVNHFSYTNWVHTWAFIQWNEMADCVGH